MNEKRIKQKAVLKTICLALLSGLSWIVFVFNMPRILLIGFLIFITIADELSSFYPLVISRDKFKAYTEKFHLTPDGLAEITGRSKYEFPVNSKGRIRLASGEGEDYKTIVEKLKQEYGEL